MWRVKLVPIFLFALQTLDASLVSSASCVIGRFPGTTVNLATDSGPTSCSVSYDLGELTNFIDPITAWSDASFSFGAAGFSADFQGQAFWSYVRLDDPPGINGIDSYARTTATGQGIFATEGPTAPGILRIQEESTVWAIDNAWANVSLSIAGHPVAYSLGGLISPPRTQSWEFPIELGTTFDVLLEFDMELFTQAFVSHGHFEWGSTNLTFSAYDLEGQPVAIRPVPEPSYGLLSLLCIAGTIALRRKS